MDTPQKTGEPAHSKNVDVSRCSLIVKSEVMRLCVSSDLHFEHHADWGETILRELADLVKSFDVLVIAGDFTNSENLYHDLKRVSQACPKPIVYVMGNHEAYFSTIGYVHGEIRRAMADTENLHFLENETCVIRGVKFAGTTLWFDHSGEFADMERHTNEFRRIRHLDERIFELGQKARNFLAAEKDSDVIVTHFLPHKRSIHPTYFGDPGNRFFHHEVDHIVESSKAKVWIHGHTHCEMDYSVGTTRVFCNPFGYPGEKEFEFKIIEILRIYGIYSS